MCIYTCFASILNPTVVTYIINNVTLRFVRGTLYFYTRNLGPYCSYLLTLLHYLVPDFPGWLLQLVASLSGETPRHHNPYSKEPKRVPMILGNPSLGVGNGYALMVRKGTCTQ